MDRVRFSVCIPAITVQRFSAAPFASPTRKKAAISSSAAPVRAVPPYPSVYPAQRIRIAARVPIFPGSQPARKAASILPMLIMESSVPVRAKDSPYCSRSRLTTTPLDMAQIPLRKKTP